MYCRRKTFKRLNYQIKIKENQNYRLNFPWLRVLFIYIGFLVAGFK